MDRSEHEHASGWQQADQNADTAPAPDAPTGGFAPMDQPLSAPPPAPIPAPSPIPSPAAYAQPAPPTWGGYAYPPQPAPPVAPQRSNKRFWAFAGAGILAAGMVFGAGYAVGKNSAKPAAAAATPAAAGATAGTLAGANGSPGGVLTGSLTDALFPLPAGASARQPKQAGAGGALTLDDFVALLYPTTSASERDVLTARGFKSAATTWFTAADGKQVALFLAEFAAPSGAQSYALALTASHRTTDPGDPSFSIGAMTDGVGFEEAKLDTLGNTRTFAYGAVGNVTLILHFYSPATLDRASTLFYVDGQAARLTGAESAAN